MLYNRFLIHGIEQFSNYSKLFVKIERKIVFMKSIFVQDITRNIKEMCIEANYFLSKDMKRALYHAKEKEESPLGKQILDQLDQNLQIAENDKIPICQDTGMTVVFIKIGQEVSIKGGNLTEAIHEGVRQGYKIGRASCRERVSS